MPAEHVPEKGRGLVIEVVAGDDNVAFMVEGEPVEKVSPYSTADRACTSFRISKRMSEIEAEELLERIHTERNAVSLGEIPDKILGALGIFAEAVVYMDSLDIIAHPREDLAQHHAVFAA